MNSLPTHYLVALRELTLHFSKVTKDWLPLGRDEGTPVEEAFAGKERAELLMGPDILGEGLALWSTGIHREFKDGCNIVCIVRQLPDGSLGFRALL